MFWPSPPRMLPALALPQTDLNRTGPANLHITCGAVLQREIGNSRCNIGEAHLLEVGTARKTIEIERAKQSQRIEPIAAIQIMHRIQRLGDSPCAKPLFIEDYGPVYSTNGRTLNFIGSITWAKSLHGA